MGCSTSNTIEESNYTNENKIEGNGNPIPTKQLKGNEINKTLAKNYEKDLNLEKLECFSENEDELEEEEEEKEEKEKVDELTKDIEKIDINK